jgi:organic radical activating enzyme
MNLCLYFNVTDYCNSRCPFCAAGVPINQPDTVHLDSILHAYDAYHLGKGDDIVINGGEPLLYPDLEIIVREAHLRGVFITLFTNGRLLSKVGPARTWLNAGVDRVSIPLHGCSATTHDGLTGRSGSFLQTLAGIKNAFLIQQESGFPAQIELKVLAVRNSLVEWPEIIDLIAHEFGSPDILVFSGLNMWSTAAHTYQTLCPTLGDMEKFTNAALVRAAENHFPVSMWSIPLCLLTGENMRMFVAHPSNQNLAINTKADPGQPFESDPSRQPGADDLCRMPSPETTSSQRMVYFDPQNPAGIEFSEEFSPNAAIDECCRACNLAVSCGPGRVFYQQLTAVSI